MKTDDFSISPTPIRQDALPELSTIESALDDNSQINAEYDKVALEIAETARADWNRARKAEIIANQQLMDDNVQSAMAAEVFQAFMTYLKTIPRGVQEKVIAKFHDINLPSKVITL